MRDVEAEPMTRFEARLAGRLREASDLVVGPIDAVAIARAAMTAAAPRRGLTGLLPRSPRWVSLGVLATLLAALAVGLLSGPGRFLLVPHRPLIVGADGLILAVDAASGSASILAEGRAPARSPDGTRIAYTLPDGLWLMNADGTGRRRVTSDWSGDEPRWSPDGQQLFGLLDDGSFGIVAADGSGSRRTGLRPYKDAGTGDWSPDGRWIAVVAVPGLLRVDARSPELTPEFLVPQGALPWLPRWSPDGQAIAYNDRAGLRVRSFPQLDDRVVVELTSGARWLAWSPDGTRIAFIQQAGDVRIIDLHTGATTSVFTPPDLSVAVLVGWAPDGAHLAVGTAETEPATTEAPAMRLWRVDLETGSATELAVGVPLRFGSVYDGGFEW